MIGYSYDKETKITPNVGTENASCWCAGKTCSLTSFLSIVQVAKRKIFV